MKLKNLEKNHLDFKIYNEKLKATQSNNLVNNNSQSNLKLYDNTL